ncbi:dihydrodipicolinate synthase family protein [Nonomuraea sp. K274]|uniref:Dihydrodipicolinate synthase family protein n=1 Tax=Nonomuraea cypriaca TaxID=1187855 RepID=A0A931A5X5_9ACTN|nr:dihydrodipicolinate synthase family protein [Nonomuraea cypriaca]MBF8185595.1 dihydrodipicolinate synthase family protein [Nonomuraea cypriaca]
MTTPTVIAALPTPFRDTGELDPRAARELFRAVNGIVDGLFVAGTTGEFAALDDAERLMLIEIALEEAGPDRVVAHVGAASAFQAARLAAAAVSLGATRLAAITPYFQPAGPDVVRDYFVRILDAAGDAALYAYLYPDLTNTDVTPEQLAAVPGLAGVKLSGRASGEVALHVAQSYDVYSGNDVQLAAVAEQGGTGVVSGLSAAFPGVFVKLARAVAGGDTAARDAHQEVADEIGAVVGPNISHLKLALDLLGLPGGASRVAAQEVDPAVRSRLVRLIERETA